MTTARRDAFTLLEIMIAIAIGMVMLAGLYWALSVQADQAQAGREVVDESTLVRQIVQKIQDDIDRSMAPFDPSTLAAATSTGTAPGSSTNQSGNSSNKTPSTTGNKNSSTTSPTTSGTPSSTSSSSSSTTASVSSTYNLGLQGTSDTLMLFLSRVPRIQLADSANVLGTTDARVVTYQVGADSEPTGLVRQDALLTQADDGTGNFVTQVQQLPQFSPQLLAPEVQSVQFNYLDPVNGWVSDWPQDAAAYDGVTQIGPPQAVEVILTLLRKNGDTITYRQVIAIRSANGPTMQSLGETPQGATGQ
jgi:prepilin-type N-terminal cleavage/methylation domain-containing protein